MWQVLSEVLSQSIPQTHPAAWQPDGNTLAVVTIRDPRDIVASLYRVRISRGGPEVGGPNGLENVLIQLSLHFGKVRRILEGPHLLLRYEQFFRDWNILWDALFRTFYVHVSLPERERIEQKFSLQANRERASQLNNFNEVGEYHIHGDHVGPVTPGSWVSALPRWAVGRVREFCRPLCEEWNYAH